MEWLKADEACPEVESSKFTRRHERKVIELRRLADRSLADGLENYCMDVLRRHHRNNHADVKILMEIEREDYMDKQLLDSHIKQVAYDMLDEGRLEEVTESQYWPLLTHVTIARIFKEERALHLQLRSGHGTSTPDCGLKGFRRKCCWDYESFSGPGSI